MRSKIISLLLLMLGWTFAPAGQPISNSAPATVTKPWQLTLPPNEIVASKPLAISSLDQYVTVCRDNTPSGTKRPLSVFVTVNGSEGGPILDMAKCLTVHGKTVGLTGLKNLLELPPQAIARGSYTVIKNEK
jgi:hypothetical protein